MEAIAMTESPEDEPAIVVTHDPPQIVLSHDLTLTPLPYSQATGEREISRVAHDPARARERQRDWIAQPGCSLHRALAQHRNEQGSHITGLLSVQGFREEAYQESVSDL